jgi:hypothetical protein
MSFLHPVRSILAMVLCTCTLLFFACREDLQVNNDDQDYPLTLRSTAIQDGVKFEWDEAQVSNFEKYVIVRADAPIPNGLKPNNNSGVFQVIFEGDERGALTFSDTNLPIVNKVYYKLYLSAGGRFLESDNVSYAFENLIESGSPSLVRFLPDSNWVIAADEFGFRLLLFDYERSVKVSEISAQVGFSGSETNIAKPFISSDGKPFMFWFPNGSSNKMIQFSLPDFNAEKQFVMNFAGFDIAPNPQSNIMVTTNYDYNNGMTVNKLSTNDIVKNYYRSEYYVRRTLALLDAATNKFLEASPNKLHIYNVNATTGAVSGSQESFVSGGTPLQQIALSPDKSMFITHMGGQIFDRQLQEVNKVPNQVNEALVDFAFSSDGEHLYSLSIDFSTFLQPTLIRKWKIQGMVQVAQRSFTSLNPKAIHATKDGGVVFVANNLNGQTKMLIKKVKL